jgi:UDP-N-acetylmuramate-alanine ligase
VPRVEADLRPGDVLVTMGAGDVRKVSHELIDRFREDRAAG